MSEVLRHVVDSISPASAAHAEGARQRLATAGAPILERLGMALAAAQHTPAPRVAGRTALVVAGDHGVGDPGVALGAEHPTIAALHAIDAGTAALASVARSAALPIVLVDAGVREPDHVPASTIRVGHRPSFDLTREPALTVVDVALLVDAGIALVVALPQHDVLVLGALGLGAEVAAAAIAGASGHATATGDAVVDAANARGLALQGATGLELLATFGGPDTAVLAGAILAAASLHMPVILDGYATAAAALVATRLAPAARGSLIAAHAGSFIHGTLLAALGLAPIFDVGLGHGEGTGAAMVVPLLDQVAALTRAK